jgi:protein-S-isoprenylcysteine O-methyltransferase Ste14
VPRTLRDRVVKWLHHVTTGDRQRRARLAPLGPLLFFVIVGVFVAGSLWLDRRLGLPAPLGGGLGYLVGAPLLAGGLLLTGVSMGVFFKTGGTPSPLHPPPALITTGLYGYVRNPMLTGEILAGVGLGLALHSSTITLVGTPLFTALFVVEILLVEEPELERRLGAAYREYRRNVPMFIPRLRPWRSPPGRPSDA